MLPLAFLAVIGLSLMGSAMPGKNLTSESHVANTQSVRGVARLAIEMDKNHTLASLSPCTDGCHDQYLSVYYQVYWREYLRTGSYLLADDQATTTARGVELVCLYECRKQGFTPPSP